MQRILFVDDEPAVLHGLRNVLRKDRSRWEMVFVVGGEAALEELKRSPFDVVVSDMRMPGMDGAQLLRRVKNDYPSIARIVLSGHAGPEMVANVLPVLNQFVAKPCDLTTSRLPSNAAPSFACFWKTCEAVGPWGRSTMPCVRITARSRYCAPSASVARCARSLPRPLD